MDRPPSIFPSNLSIEECRASVAGFPGFRESKKYDHLVFNYDFAFRQSFPDPQKAPDEHTARLLLVRRECRGLIFHQETGAVLARRLHKFFNINEMDETMPECIDLSQPHIILEKADGCLISPFVAEGKMRWGTKLGITEVTDTIEKKFLGEHPDKDYNGFSKKWIEKGYTPIFELCAAKHQVILEYPEDKMVLLALRHNLTGDYIPFGEMKKDADSSSVPTVIPWPGLVYQRDYSDATELVSKIKAIDAIEGFVIVFDNGLMYKVKTDWYIRRSKRANECAFFEKDIWRHVLEGTIDDFAESLGPRRLEAIGKFGLGLFAAIEQAKDYVTTFVQECKDQKMLKKDFFAHINQEAKKDGCHPLIKNHRGLFLKVFDGGDPYKTVIEYVKKNTGTSHEIDFIRYDVCAGLKISLNDGSVD